MCNLKGYRHLLFVCVLQTEKLWFVIRDLWIYATIESCVWKFFVFYLLFIAILCFNGGCGITVLILGDLNN